MKRAGKNSGVYQYFKNNVLISEGTIDEISEKEGISKITLWGRIQRYKNGATKTSHILEKVRNSVYIYALFFEDECIGVGTLKELSEKCNFHVDYLTRLSNGNYNKGKYNKLRMFKQVG